MDASLESRVQHALTASPMRRVRHGLGGSHTVVTYPPLDALEPIDGDPPDVLPSSEPVHLYFHIAFCEFICPFCHYTKTYHGSGRKNPQLEAYVIALRDEVRTRIKQLKGASVASVYVGGGTPTSLSIEHLSTLFDTIFEIAPTVNRFCFETSPVTVTEGQGAEKISLLISRGVNRLSVGIQSFDEKLLRAFRGHGQATVVKALEVLTRLGIEVNIDLIQDLPFQTRESIVRDIEWVGKFRPSQVTWYILRFHDESSMARSFKRGDLAGLADDTESALRRDLIIREMESLGYVSQPGCRFTLSTETDVYKVVRGGTGSRLLGFGASSYSHGWGWFFRNVTSHHVRSGIQAYIDRIRAGRSAVAFASRIDAGEELASQICVSSRRFLPYNLLSKDAVSWRDTRFIVSRLCNAGLMEQADDGWRPTRVGRLFEEEIASLFYSPPMRHRLRDVGTYWAPDSWFATPRPVSLR